MGQGTEDALTLVAVCDVAVFGLPSIDNEELDLG